MARYLILFALAIAILVLVLFVAGQAGLLRGKPPGDIGIKDGKLKRPSLTENSVSSQADLWPEHPLRDYARIAPLKVKDDGEAEMAQIVATLKTMPRTEIISQDGAYIHAQCTTQMLKFTDDIEFFLDAPAGTIHVRSASRVGRKDFAVNRARVEQIRTALGQ